MRQRPLSLLAIATVLLLMFALACNSSAAPTATTAPTATPTKAPTQATPTPTKAAVVATPTPSTAAAPTPTPGEQPKKGGTMNMVEAGTPEHYDLYLGYSPTWQLQIPKAYNNLFVNYAGDKVECEICSSAGWRLEDGGKTMVFNIQPGIKYHNGKELVAADVAYSIKMMMGQIDGIVSARVGWVKEYIDSFETPSKYELRIKLVRPSIMVPKLLSTSFAGIIPDGTPRDEFKKAPIGTGPFMLTGLVQNASATYERNPNYFKPGLPYLDKVQVSVAVDPNTQWAAFFSHKVEYRTISEEPTEQYLNQLFKMRDDGKITITQTPGTAGYYGTWMVGSKPPFNDIKMRQAVNLAMDRVGVGQATFGNRHKAQLMMFLPEQEYGTPADKIWNVVPGWGTGAKKVEEQQQAKKLLADAGYPSGIDLPMFRSTTSNIGYAAGPEIVQSQLKEVGIRTTFDIAKSGSDFAARLANYDYLFQVYIFYAITGDPDEAIGQYMITGGSRNPTGYSNPQVDKLFVQMSAEADPVKRKQVFLQIQDLILKDLWYAPLANHDGAVYIYPTIKGINIGLSAAFSSGFNRGDRLWLQQ